MAIQSMAICRGQRSLPPPPAPAITVPTKAALGEHANAPADAHTVVVEFNLVLADPLRETGN